MNIRTKTIIGGTVFLYSALALAQGTGSASSPASGASSPDGTGVPPDPLWFVAGIAIGLIIGYLVGRASGRSKPTVARAAAVS